MDETRTGGGRGLADSDKLGKGGDKNDQKSWTSFLNRPISIGNGKRVNLKLVTIEHTYNRNIARTHTIISRLICILYRVHFGNYQLQSDCVGVSWVGEQI